MGYMDHHSYTWGIFIPAGVIIGFLVFMFLLFPPIIAAAVLILMGVSVTAGLVIVEIANRSERCGWDHKPELHQKWLDKHNRPSKKAYREHQEWLQEHIERGKWGGPNS